MLAVDRAQLRRALIVLSCAGGLAFVSLTRVPFCPLAGVLGVPCPGCGLTRATLALLHGNLRQALHLHPLVLLLAPIFIGAMGNIALSYVRGPRAAKSSSPWLASRSASTLAAILLAATLGVWGLRFLGYFGGPVPVQTFNAWSRAQH